VVASRPVLIDVDVSVPEITKGELTVSGKSVLFDIAVSESLMIQYIDLDESVPQYRALCTACSSFNKEKSFKPGRHRLVIRAIDSAGNADSFEQTVYLLQ